jgi:hypothetical protein
MPYLKVKSSLVILQFYFQITNKYRAVSDNVDIDTWFLADFIQNWPYQEEYLV